MKREISPQKSLRKHAQGKVMQIVKDPILPRRETRRENDGIAMTRARERKTSIVLREIETKV